ncbi:MAG: hypothetical protein ACE5EE_02445 [Fidelibacterota bacterium]
MQKLIITLCIFIVLSLKAEERMNVSSLVFFDATYNETVSFNITRSYLDFRKSLSADIAARVTVDAARIGSTDSLIINEHLTFYVKYAYLVWNTEAGSFLIGQQPTNYFGPSTATWGLRFIEKQPSDLWKFDPTADLGLSYRKNFSENLLIHLAAYNGRGYKYGENDKYKRLSVLISLGEQRLNANSGWNAGGVVSYEPYDDSTSMKKVLRLSGFAGYANNSFRLGVEVLKSDDNGGSNSQLYSIYGNLSLMETLDVLARVDLYNRDVEIDGDGKTYLITGIHYQPTVGFSIAPSIHYTNYEDDTDPVISIKFNFQFRF